MCAARSGSAPGEPEPGQQQGHLGVAAGERDLPPSIPHRSLQSLLYYILSYFPAASPMMPMIHADPTYNGNIILSSDSFSTRRIHDRHTLHSVHVGGRTLQVGRRRTWTILAVFTLDSEAGSDFWGRTRTTAQPPPPPPPLLE